jgi:very-short-patch-repair endonuclease
MSLPEVVLWEELRGGRLEGHRFRRQHPVGPYIVDFYCARSRLAVEVDGAAHGFAVRALHDQRRDRWLTGRGIRILRFDAVDILEDRRLEGTLTMIQNAANMTAEK